MADHSQTDIVAWLEERAENAERIGATKRGADREGWDEDARYFREAIQVISEAVRDAERWHKARRYLAIEDVAGWGGPDWRGHDPDEDESVKTDRAIDALPEGPE